MTLETQSGARIDVADLRGKWLLVDFIYTRCPTYCVALGSEFAQLQDRLAGPLAKGAVELVSISFDRRTIRRQSSRLTCSAHTAAVQGGSPRDRSAPTDSIGSSGPLASP